MSHAETVSEILTLIECDLRALERFQMFDSMEAEDEKNAIQ
jgi:hypothetical protein